MSSQPTGPSSGPLQLFSNSPREKSARGMYLKVFLGGLFMVIFMIFTILPIYWGALWKIPAHNLDGWVVDFDGSLIGERVSQALQSPQVSSTSRITWHIKSADEFNGSPEELAHAVREERTWAGIAIMPNVSSNLTSALATPNPSYDGSRGIIAYGVEARNENGFRSLVRPSLDGALRAITQQISLQVSQQLTSSGSSGSDAQIAEILRTAPQTIISPVGYTIDNLIPFDQPVATAATFVGMLYQLIMSFFVVMISLAAREASGYAHHLKTSSIIALRLASSVFAYCMISLFYCLLNLAFHLDVGRKFGSGAGFMIFWMVNWIGTLAVGLALESMITLLTPKGIPFFMLLWIIANLSTCIFPLQVLPKIFRYGYAMPFYNLSRALRTIVFGTKNSVGEVVGILLAWVVVSCITLAFFQWFVRRGSSSAEGKNVEESGSSVSSRASIQPQKEAPHHHKRSGEDVDAVDAAMLDIDEQKANA
ncbi:hypothetical protein BKA70DRAFT_1560776 [Coprinopsis sp. MPI-PUGE-AT-0042]|nr:hypothetical protein BKA70DRAFT_1560776 [Coprinopsis sp. MPI-PUGE-AT-0042]